MCVWYRGEDGRKDANAYLKASDAWRKRAVRNLDADAGGHATWEWNTEAPPKPPKGLIVFIGLAETMRLQCA